MQRQRLISTRHGALMPDAAFASRSVRRCRAAARQRRAYIYEFSVRDDVIEMISMRERADAPRRDVAQAARQDAQRRDERRAHARQCECVREPPCRL